MQFFKKSTTCEISKFSNLIFPQSFLSWLFFGWMLKAPPLIPRTYIFWVLKCNCQTHDVSLGQIFQNPRFAKLGLYNMLDNKFDQSHHCRPLFIGHTFLLIYSFFEHIFEHINVPLLGL